MRTWSIQLSYTARDDDGKPFRARSVFHVDAPGISEAYEGAEKGLLASNVEGFKLGAIIPGKHMMIP